MGPGAREILGWGRAARGANHMRRVTPAIVGKKGCRGRAGERPLVSIEAPHLARRNGS